MQVAGRVEDYNNAVAELGGVLGVPWNPTFSPSIAALANSAVTRCDVLVPGCMLRTKLMRQL